MAATLTLKLPEERVYRKIVQTGFRLLEETVLGEQVRRVAYLNLKQTTASTRPGIVAFRPNCGRLPQ